MFDLPLHVMAMALALASSVPLAWWAASAPRDDDTARRQRLAVAREHDLREVVLRQGGTERVLLPGFGVLAGLVRRVTPTFMLESLERKVVLAGAAQRSPLEQVLAMKLLLGLAGFVLGAIRYSADLGDMRQLMWLILLTVGGFLLPDFLLGARGRRRQESIGRELPDMLDQVTISVEAGLGFEAALNHVSGSLDGPIGEELRYTLQDIRLGMSREAAFRALIDRTEVIELRRFLSSLIQADRLGIPIAQVLRSQAAEMRLIRRQTAEEEAQKVPLKVIFPLILFILPALIIVVVGPGVLDIIDTFNLE